MKVLKQKDFSPPASRWHSTTNQLMLLLHRPASTDMIHDTSATVEKDFNRL